MKRKPDLVVRPGTEYVITVFFLAFIMFILFLTLTVELYPEQGSLQLFFAALLVLILWSGYAVLRGRNKRIFVFGWGMIFRDTLGHLTRVRYRDITSIRISTGRRYVLTVEFYTKDDYVGSCYSTDENYTSFMSYLSARMPEKLEWPQRL